MRNSGKLLILGILVLAAALAGAAWWFRYETTHRAAHFWGPETARLIRDAPKVTLFQKPSADTIRQALEEPTRASFDDSAVDVSHARGLLHLRNALLEDRSFLWPASGEQPLAPPEDTEYWVLSFYFPNSHNAAVVMFTEDCRLAACHEPRRFAYLVRTISTEPIAAGLREMFAEFTAPHAGDSSPSLR